MKTEKLIAQDFYFYNNGRTSINKQIFKKHYTGQYYTDLVECSRAIRVFGTQEEIDDAVNEYCRKHWFDY
jgi:hypothetical protein